MDLKEEAILGEAIHRHWYYVSKGRALARFLGDVPGGEILDVGAGSGIFSKMLIERGLVTRSTCVDTGYLADRDETHAGRPLAFRRSVTATDASLILMMDVIEHVDDDVGLLAHYASMLPPGGQVLVTVPAFQALWSGHDVFLEHKRRYTLPQVETAMRKAGLEVVRGSYYFGFVLPLAAAVRLGDRGAVPKSGLSAHHPLVNAALIAVNALELPLMRLNRLGGLSVFCLARTGRSI
ncbi:MAG: class I SAM-dependent methyltransferase [Alphaproteobacteria bacterium]|nr:class I SAM-dependent methyltransferase [Alphaproteobacteria bacterium]